MLKFLHGSYFQMELRPRKPLGYYRNLLKSSLDIREEWWIAKTWNKNDLFDVK